jgi:LPS export ABC transporter protein LptC
MKKILFLLAIISLVSCSRKAAEEEQDEGEAYTGPLIEADSVEILYSDSAIVVIRVQAAKQYEYENGNREFPEGIFVEFFEKDGTISSTLEADRGYYFREQDRYTAVGQVEIKSKKDQNELYTDTLHWSPPEEKVYTKAKVLIAQGTDTLRGQGLEAAQDFSTYEILKPEAEIELGEEEPLSSPDSTQPQPNLPSPNLPNE